MEIVSSGHMVELNHCPSKPPLEVSNDEIPISGGKTKWRSYDRGMLLVPNQNKKTMPSDNIHSSMQISSLSK